jgi:anthocyanidin reductase
MEKNSHLKDLQALGPLEVFRADLQEEGSFDDAVAGCDYAFLVAAPVNLNAENPEVKYSHYTTWHEFFTLSLTLNSGATVYRLLLFTIARSDSNTFSNGRKT